MQFADRLQLLINSIIQDKKKLILVVCLLGFLLIGGIIAGVFLGSPSRSGGGTSQTAETGTSKNSFGLGSKTVPGPTLEPTKTPEEIAYLTAIPAAPTDIPFITKKDLDEFEPHGSPTPTPLPGVFYIPNGQQNDLEIRYYYENAGDSFDQVRVVNTKTTEERTIGLTFHHTPGDPAFFSRDFSQVYFIGGSRSEYNQIAVYNIAKNKIEKIITLDDIKKAIPQLKLDETAVLSMLIPSLDKTKFAVAYGNTFNLNRITPDTRIIVINLLTSKMIMLPVTAGLPYGWKDNNTVQYTVNTANPNVNDEFEVAVPSF